MGIFLDHWERKKYEKTGRYRDAMNTFLVQGCIPEIQDSLKGDTRYGESVSRSAKGFEKNYDEETCF